MEYPKQWLVTIDKSDNSSKALDYAATMYASLADKPNVVLIHVIQDITHTQSIDPKHAKNLEKDRARHLLKESFEKFKDTAGSADNVSKMLLIGNPRKLIVEIARSNGTDHIIMGGHDFKWDISKIMKGDVSNYVLHHMDCVITIIK